MSIEDDHSTSSRNAQLQWDEQGQPHSREFDDCYFSRANGLEESRYVFLQRNRLAERFAQLPDNAVFVVGETGFGTGLNFLACWQLWQQKAPATAHLHFVSVEKFPLSKPDLTQALGLWPELQPLSQQLLEHYPAITHEGFHRLKFGGHGAAKVSLTLIIDDACSGFEQLLNSDHPAHQHTQRGIDAWFLDGFAPSKNPQMWSEDLFNLLHKLSAPQATAATFTAAGLVKRGLHNNGFEVVKVAGFGRKREMITARLQQPFTPPAVADFPTMAHSSSWSVPWYCKAQSEPCINPVKDSSAKQAVVVGAGIAGCHSARALAERGWQVTVLERHPQPAQEGSGNAQGLLYAKLSHKQESLADFNLLALQYAQRHYQAFWNNESSNGSTDTDEQTVGQRCAVLQLAYDDQIADQQLKLMQRFEQDSYKQQDLLQAVDQQTANELAGIDLPYGGLLFPHSGWLSPPVLCQQLLQHPNIQCHFQTDVTELELHENLNEQAPVWYLTTSQGEFHSPYVILSTAHHCKQFGPTAQLPLKPIRGQMSQVAVSDYSAQLRIALCGEGYIAPATNNQHCFGATYSTKDLQLHIRPEEHRHNIDLVQQLAPELAASIDTDEIDGRCALRCTSPDYLPLVGPVAKRETLGQDFALLLKNANASIATPGQYWPGLYVNVAHGSRGLAYTPICAELLAAELNQEPPPLERSQRLALHPSRFWIRQLIRRQPLV